VLPSEPFGPVFDGDIGPSKLVAALPALPCPLPTMKPLEAGSDAALPLAAPDPELALLPPAPRLGEPLPVVLPLQAATRQHTPSSARNVSLVARGDLGV
jgi:hypothetical protein